MKKSRGKASPRVERSSDRGPESIMNLLAGQAKKEEPMPFRLEEDRAILEEFSKAPFGSFRKEREKKVCGAILKYLIYNYGDYEACMETEMVKRLQIPRFKLRKILGILEWEGLIDSVTVATSRPYVVTSISKALEKGYLEFGQEEAENMVRLLPSLGAPSIPVYGSYPPLSTGISGVVESIPDDPSISRVWRRIWSKANEKYADIQYPFREGAITSTTPMGDYQLLHCMISANGSKLIQDVLLQLETYDDITENDIQKALEKVVDRNLRLVMRMAQPLSDSIKRKGFEETSRTLRKAEFDASRINTGRYKFEVLTESITNMDSGTGSDVKILDAMGYCEELGGFVGYHSAKLTTSHLRILASVLRAAARFAKTVNTSLDLAKQCETLANSFEEAARPKPQPT